MNAKYTVVVVELPYHDAHRRCKLHIVKVKGKKEPIYFLKDDNGWSIDDPGLEMLAAHKYQTGNFQKT